MGCACVVGERDTVAMVMQPLEDLELPLSGEALPIVIEVLPEQAQWRNVTPLAMKINNMERTMENAMCNSFFIFGMQNNMVFAN